MARVTATKSTTRKKKAPRIVIEDAIRKLFRTQIDIFLSELENDEEFEGEVPDLKPRDKSKIAGVLFDAFGDAVYTMVDCAVANEVELVVNGYNEKEEEEGSDGEDEYEDED